MRVHQTYLELAHAILKLDNREEVARCLLHEIPYLVLTKSLWHCVVFQGFKKDYDLASRLSMGFVWAKTSLGWDYFNEMHHKLKGKEEGI